MGISVEPPGPADPITPQTSHASFGSVTGPAAGGTIIATAALPAGVYKVDLYLRISGTITAAEENNMQLLNGAAVQNQLPVQAPAATVAADPPITQYKASNATTFSVQAIAAAGVAAVYTVLIVATQVG